jgi:hypothetical protein
MIALPYVSLSFFLFLLYVFGNLRKIYKHESIITAFVVFLLFFGLRGYIFTDVFNYIGFFNRVPSMLAGKNETTWLRFSYWEPGFTYYVSFFKIFTESFLVFAFFDTCLNLILLYKALEWFDGNTCLNYMIMIAMMGLSLFANNMRNIKSILLFMISLRYVDRNILKYLFFCLIAVLFHSSSIIYFPLYFIVSKKYPFFFFIILFMISIFFFIAGRNIIINIFIFFIDKISGRYSNIIENYLLGDSLLSTESRGFSLGLLEKIGTLFLILLFFKPLYKNRKMIIATNCFLFYFFTYFVFSGFLTVSYRLSGIFVFSYWILWPSLLKNIRTKYMKEFFLVCLLIYTLLKCSLYFQKVQLYENILFGAMDIEARKRWNGL